MWYLLQHSPLESSIEYAQINYLHVIFVPKHYTKIVVRICINNSIKCDVCDKTFHLNGCLNVHNFFSSHLLVILVIKHSLRMVIWLCKKLHLILLQQISLNWSFEYAQIIYLHVMFVIKHSTKMVIWICKNIYLHVIFVTKHFFKMVIWIFKNYSFTFINTFL